MRYVLSSLIVKLVYQTSISNCVYNEVKWGRSYHFDLSVFYCMTIWNQDIIYKVPYLSSIFSFKFIPFSYPLSAHVVYIRLFQSFKQLNNIGRLMNNSLLPQLNTIEVYFKKKAVYNIRSKCNSFSKLKSCHRYF